MDIPTRRRSSLPLPNSLFDTWPETKQVSSHRIGAKRVISDLAICNAPTPEYVLHEQLKYLQHQVGVALVDYIWEAGGVATVALQLRQQRDYYDMAEELYLTGDVNPAMHIGYQLTVPHFEEVVHHVMWPADWYCRYCGSLNDGMKHPRTCLSCQAPKPEKYF